MKPDYSRIPRHTLKTLEAWIATGRHLDDDDEAEAFCLAIVMNDLEAAIAHADEANLGALPQIMHWLSHQRRGAAMGVRPRWAPGPWLRACTPAAKSERTGLKRGIVLFPAERFYGSSRSANTTLICGGALAGAARWTGGLSR